MSKTEMMTLIETMNNYNELAAKVKAKADTIRDSIKAEMERQAVEELICGQYIVRYTSVISNRFDSTTFKRLYADLYKDFMICARVRSGMENARAKGRRIGRPQLAKEDIPSAFLRHYPAYKAGNLNVTELARVCDLSRTTVYKYMGLLEKNSTAILH